MNALEAAQVLYRSGSKKEAVNVLQFLWESPARKPSEEFKVFCALVEIWTAQDPSAVLTFLDAVITGEGEFETFWMRRSLAEQYVLLDWHGQIAYGLGDRNLAFESLSRAASLGRDTSLIWRQLGSIYIDNNDLDLGLRYVRRSLHLFRQLDLDLLSGRDQPMGSFMGQHPLNTAHGLEDYLEILLKITRLAKGQRNLKAVRELVLEMIHQFPEERRLPRIRLLLEKAIVESSLSMTALPKIQASGAEARDG
jgi:hypothetical protein